MRSELSLGNDSSVESCTAGRLFKIFSSPTVKILLDLVTETMMKVGQCSALHEVLLAILQSRYEPGGTFSSLKAYYKQKPII